MARRRAVGVIGVIAGLALLAACSGQPETPAPTSLPTQTVTPEPSTPPSGTPEPTRFPTDQLPERLSDLVTEPVLPDEASEFTTDGAAAFAHYIIDASTLIHANGDVHPLLAVCSDGSGFCEALAEQAPSFADGSRVRFGGLSSIEVTNVELYADEQVAFVVADYSRDPYIDLDRHGALLEDVEGNEYPVIFHLTFQGDQWILETAGSA